MKAFLSVHEKETERIRRMRAYLVGAVPNPRLNRNQQFAFFALSRFFKQIVSRGLNRKVIVDLYAIY